MCMGEVNNIYSIVLEIVKGRDSIERNPITKTHTLNIGCEKQADFTISTVLLVLWDTLYIILCYCTNISVYTNTAHSNNKMGL